MAIESIVRNFNADGYVIVPGLFSPEDVARFESELAAYIREFVPRQPPGTVYYEEDRPDVIKSLFKMHKHGEFFGALERESRVMAIVGALIPGGLKCRDVGYFAKAARDGSVTPPHQDNAFQHFGPPYMLKASIALDAHTEANGAMICLKGSHQHGVFPHRASGVMSFSQSLADDVDVSPYPEVSMCLSPGDLMVHHGNTIHKSGANRTEQSRRMISITYDSSLAQRDEVSAQRVRSELRAMHETHTGAGQG